MANDYSVTWACGSHCVGVGNTSTPLKRPPTSSTARACRQIGDRYRSDGCRLSDGDECWAIGQNTKGVGIIVRAPLQGSLGLQGLEHDPRPAGQLELEALIGIP
jgi:hypothetical protein